MRKISFLPAVIISRDADSCLDLRSREFGSMKDSGGALANRSRSTENNF